MGTKYVDEGRSDIDAGARRFFSSGLAVGLFDEEMTGIRFLRRCDIGILGGTAAGFGRFDGGGFVARGFQLFLTVRKRIR
jgi:hypothetical protein